LMMRQGLLNAFELQRRKNRVTGWTHPVQRGQD
jgi:hypothetical protein